MTSPTPDISQLSLSPSAKTREYDSFNDAKTFHYSTSPPLHSNISPQFYNTQASLGPQSVKKPARAGLPTQWYDNPQPGNLDDRALSPPHTSDISSGGGSPPLAAPQLYTNQSQPAAGQNEDDIIPTAIVIKNIPFTVKRETLLDLIASLNIPTPYAFNYHIDGQGAFRGLAFANFRLPADADAVVAALNGFDVQGRKLRVEYKKVLLAGEKERIEREKALRRMRSMQMEKERDAYVRSAGQQEQQPTHWDDFGPIHTVPSLSNLNGTPGNNGALNNGMGYNGMNNGNNSPPSMMGGFSSPSPARTYSGVGLGMPNQSQQQQQQHQQPVGLPSLPIIQPPQQYPSPPPTTPAKSTTELDLNDPSTLEIYSRILVFKEDRMRDELAFSRNLTPKQRRVVHLVAQRLGVYHYSVGEGEERYAVVTRIERESAPRAPTRHVSQTMSQAPTSFLHLPPGPIHSQSHSPSSPIGRSPGAPGLRVKKSMPDLASLHAPPSRLHTRSSNGNIREGYATIGISPRRNRGDNFGSLFGNNGNSNIPPVPSLPSLLTGESAVLRQPRGPGAGGFGARRPTNESRPSGGLDARSHEPLEI